MSKLSLKEYWDALDNIKKGKPVNVPPGGRITNDQVSIEAGRGRGSIKKSRESYQELIAAIESAENDRQKFSNKDEEKYQRRRTEAERFKLLYQQSVAREISLAKENMELKRKIRLLESKSVRTLTKIQAPI